MNAFDANTAAASDTLDDVEDESPEARRYAVVGISYRDAPTRIRAAAYAALPTVAARALAEGSNYIDDVVVIHTCSRVEWVIVADEPSFAAALLVSALQKQMQLAVDGFALSQVHQKLGAAALHYVLRVAVGLDSVAEGETAVGRQMVRAFADAHAASPLSPPLRRLWRRVEDTVTQARRVVNDRAPVGVHSLVSAAMTRARVPHDAAALVFGLGDIGTTTLQTLQLQWSDAHGHRRATFDAFLHDAQRAPVVVVCSGAPSPFLRLPQRNDAPLCIDIGSPPQVLSAPGWTLLTLDELLHDGGIELTSSDRDRLSALLLQAVRARPRHNQRSLLMQLQQHKEVFLREQLPAALHGIDVDAASKIERAFRAYVHTVMVAVRGEDRAEHAAQDEGDSDV
jgi:glutamyl-tRNA reductase